MTTTVGFLIAIFFVVAAVDWAAVAAQRKPVEYAAKPGCMAVLVAVATVMEYDDGSVRWPLIAALVLSLIGDIFLMLPGRQLDDEGPNMFVAGLVAFLLAHLAYIAAFVIDGVGWEWALLGVAVMLLHLSTLGRRVVVAVRAVEPAMTGPVLAYIAVISVMVIVAFGTGDPWAMAGAVLFAGSDTLIAWDRFVRPHRWVPVAIVVSYHVAQALLVVSFLG